MNIRFLPQAEWELDEAFEWYEAQHQRLGYLFVDEFDAVLRRIQTYPDAQRIPWLLSLINTVSRDIGTTDFSVSDAPGCRR